MSKTLIAPELEIFPNRYRWSVEACNRLMDLGFLEGRFEVLDGEVISKSSPSTPRPTSLPWLRILTRPSPSPTYYRLSPLDWHDGVPVVGAWILHGNRHLRAGTQPETGLEPGG